MRRRRRRGRARTSRWRWSACRRGRARSSSCTMAWTRIGVFVGTKRTLVAVIRRSLQPDGEEVDPVVEEEVVPQPQVEELFGNRVHRLLANQVLLLAPPCLHLQLVELDIHQVPGQQTLLREPVLHILALFLNPQSLAYTLHPMRQHVLLLLLQLVHRAVEQPVDRQLVRQQGEEELELAHLAVAQ